MRPPTSTEMRSASENTASMSCSIKRIVYCPFTLANSFDIERFLDAQTRHRLVEQQHDRMGCERHAELELPVLAVRHPRRDDVAEAGKADVRDQLARGPPQARNPLRRLPEAETVALGGLHGERNVALGGEAVEDARDLERSRQPEPRAAGGRQLGDVAPVEDDPPRIRLELAGQLSDQRGLAGAVGT